MSGRVTDADLRRVHCIAALADHFGEAAGTEYGWAEALDEGRGGEALPAGFYRYPPQTRVLYDLVCEGEWIDRYDPGLLFEVVAEPDRAEEVDLETSLQLLFGLMRGEHFSTGAWGAAVAQGLVARLLRRIGELVGVRQERCAA